MLDRFEKFLGTLSEVYRYLHRLTTDEMKKYDLKGPYAVYFITLYRYGKLTATQLGSKCERNKADVSRAIADLEERGFTFRHINIHSGAYRAQISLTEKGYKVAEMMCERVEAVMKFAGKDLTDESRRVFYEAFESIAYNMKSISGGESERDGYST